jgi:hypothetical protein
MRDNLKLSLFEIVGSPLCVAASDGQKVYERLESAFLAGQEVMLSFHNITTLTSAFLNAAIGQLYGEFSEEQIRALLKVQDMQNDDLALLKRVVETAKLYFKDKLVSLVRECAEYRPDYFGSLATAILWQLKKPTAMAKLPPVKEEETP